tara:strand:+ start:1207 stop:2367 length:1161 start_codon:yes stop_codon:yes gene_type:complete
MNIHEHQAKEILKEYGAPVPRGIAVTDLNNLEDKLRKIDAKTLVLKAQIHAGGRGKAGGVKLIENRINLLNEAKLMLNKKLVTHQTGPEGRQVKRLYIEEASEIKEEFYLSCLVDRASSKIAFISSTEGGTDIEAIAIKYPKKISTSLVELNNEINEKDILKITKNFNFTIDQEKEAKKIIQALYKILIEKDATLIEINPLIINKKNNLICLDAKMNFDDNAVFRRPEISKLRDLNEEDPTEIEASKFDLSYIKLDGSIGCMVNGAGLAMATMDIIKLYGEEPANFLDVGGGASKEKVSAAFKLILSDKNIKGILINIFGGIMRCDVLAQGLVEAAKETNLTVPLVVRLAGTNFEEGNKILKESGLKIVPANDLNDAAQKIVKAIK